MDRRRLQQIKPDGVAACDVSSEAQGRNDRMERPTPLKGLTVLDMSQGIAGPSCASHFAAYGARVIKLEPREGDWIRNLGSRIAGASSATIVYNRGKESIAVDLKTEEGREIALELGEKADVVLESARPGVMERLGLGFAQFSERNPSVVYVSISGYGQRGPKRETPMVDTVGQAFSGLMSVIRARDGAPVKIDVPLIDAITGLYAFQAASMELWGRKSGAPGRHIDVSLMQSAAHIQAINIVEHAFAGRPPVLLNPPAGNYPTADGWIAITLVTEAQYQAICRSVGRPELATDPRYATFAARRDHLAALRAELDVELKKKPTREWAEIFAREGALGQPINDYGDWLGDAHVTAVDAAPDYELATGDMVRLPHLPGGIMDDAAVPIIGEHTRSVLTELAYTREEIADLVRRGVVVDIDGE
jgi:crotonobetainyl-CoA:carnitine CoA-transferase CaiB-like acyl-CoA transferase